MIRISKAETTTIIATVLGEEGRPPESIYDFVQGIVAHANELFKLEIGQLNTLLSEVPNG